MIGGNAQQVPSEVDHGKGVFIRFLPFPCPHAVSRQIATTLISIDGLVDNFRNWSYVYWKSLKGIIFKLILLQPTSREDVFLYRLVDTIAILRSFNIND